MAPYQRRFYRNRPYWRRRKRRFYTKRWRPRTTFRNRRKRRVRRHFFKKFYKKKLKFIRLKEWQPTTIKKCTIKGFLTLFAGARGRQNNNYASYRESFVPEGEPGGGGWSIQTLSLGILYQLNNDLLNYWTKSNDGLNLCRYLGCSVTCYRQPYVDYIFHWFHDPPNRVTKYYYASLHPQKLLQLKNKVIIPSFATQPHKRKSYKKFFIPPPKPFKNQWFFQQHLSSFNLLYIATSAVSLTNMTQSYKSKNNNVSLYCLNTAFYTHPNFQYARTIQYGYSPNHHYYLYGLRQPHTPTTDKLKDLVFLANSMLNEPGRPAGTSTKDTKNAWGNPFFYEWLTGDTAEEYFSTKPPDELITSTTQEYTIQQELSKTYLAKKEQPNIETLRYNPHKDKGKGNKVYLIPTYAATQNSWEPTTDTDLLLQDFPLWIMLWGFEDVIKKMGKCNNLDYDWVLVINCSYLDIKKPYIVPLSESFIHGQGPYDTDRDQIKGLDHAHWYPCYRYQREVVNEICMSGPAVFRADYQEAYEAIIKYKFFFKWGGNLSRVESVYDPNSQPITPYPSDQLLQNEIINPATNIETFLYPWDFRRDILTQTAADRITKSSYTDYSLFTDATTDVQIFKTPQTQTTTEKEKEEILLHLQQLQQHNQQLRKRLLRMKLKLMDP
nr:MAG: ORF1 [TTV-like mini virus]